jgi:hypothetical protein
MRTTIEIKPEHRSALLALAARRGHKGFSMVLAEAIEAFLRNDGERQRKKRKLLSLAGSVSEQDAAELRNTTRTVRESWR